MRLIFGPYVVQIWSRNHPIVRQETPRPPPCGLSRTQEISFRADQEGGLRSNQRVLDTGHGRALGSWAGPGVRVAFRVQGSGFRIQGSGYPTAPGAPTSSTSGSSGITPGVRVATHAGSSNACARRRGTQNRKTPRTVTNQIFF